MNTSRKPPRGCISCHKRRLKCDQIRPSCLQCQRAGVVCPGYRDLVTRLFPDQSTELVRRPQRSRASQSASSRGGATSASASASKPRPPAVQEPVKANTGRKYQHNTPSTGLQIAHALNIPLMERSIGIFLQYYVLDDSFPGQVHLTSSQIAHHASSSQAVRYACSAIGMAILANTANNSSLIVEARANYTKALHLTNVALRNNASSLQDTTLNGVILLGMFEVMASGAPKSLDNWEKHIAGAAAFLELWDSRQVCSNTGLQLFTQLRTELMANCLRTQTHIPETMKKLSGIVQKCRSRQDSLVEGLVALIAALTDLLADVKGNGLPDPVQAIGRALAIDQKLKSWSQVLPPRWQYVLRSSKNDKKKSLIAELAFNDYYHVYGDLWACNVWNYYRNARVLLNLLIRDRLLVYLTIEPYPQWRDLLEESKKNIQLLAVDILLSVPYSMAMQFASLQRDMSQTRVGGCLGGYYILWPLYVAASVQTPGSDMRLWAAGRLEYIGRSMGIGQALLMARVIRAELPPGALSIYDYCHSYSSGR